MSVHKTGKYKNLIQQYGLFHVNSNKTGSNSLGVVGEYNNSNTYAGLIYDQVTGEFYAFNGLTDNPFPTDTVPINGNGFTRAALNVGTLKPTSVVSSGNISSTSGNITATSGNVTGGNIRISANTITTTDTNGALTISPNGSGALNLGGASNAVILPNNPVGNMEAATKLYVDTYVQGLSVKNECRVRTTGDLENIATASGSGVTRKITNNANGAIGDDSSYFDGITLILNDRILVMQQGNGADNGIYYVTDVGSVSTPWVITRAVDFNQSSDIETGAFTFIREGSIYATSGWVMSTPAPIVLDTTVLTFIQFSQMGVIVGTQLNPAAYNIFRDKTSNSLNFRGLLMTNTSGGNSTSILEATQNSTNVTLNIDQSKITGTGALASGSIASGFGTISTTNNITTTTTMTAGTLQTTSALLSANQSTLSFGGASTNNVVSIPDNLADALNVKVGTDSFMRFVSSTGSHSVDISKQVNLPNGVLNFNNGNTATNKISLFTNLADALSIRDDTTALNYITFDTTTGSPVATIGVPLAVSSASTFNSDVFVNSGFRTKVQTISTNTTLDATQSVINVNANAAAVTITLPTASANAGRRYRIIKSDSSANAVTIAVQTGDFLDGIINDTLILSEQYDHTDIMSGNGTGWTIY